MSKKTGKRKKAARAKKQCADKKKRTNIKIYHASAKFKRVKLETCLGRSQPDPMRPLKPVYNIFVDEVHVKTFGYWDVIDAINLERSFQGLTAINTFTPAQALLFFEVRDVIERLFLKILKNILNDYHNSSEYRHLPTLSPAKQFITTMRGRL